MGIINVTTDSFSDGGLFSDHSRAIAHGLAMTDAGATIIDVGGESTRPGAEPVSEPDEMARVLPVIRALASKTQAAISIDTMKPTVARAAIEAGATIVNDVTGLRQEAMREVVRSTGCGAIAMHMQGTPKDMQIAPHYEDVCAEIEKFFRQTLDACLASHIDPMCLAFDPGIGFGKTLAHNFSLLRNLGALRVADRPLVLGVSRKSFLGKALGSDALADRDWPTVALTAYGRAQGSNVVRVHDVAPNFQALRMMEALLAP